MALCAGARRAREPSSRLGAGTAMVSISHSRGGRRAAGREMDPPSRRAGTSNRHKVFVSYHHDNDRKCKNRFLEDRAYSSSLVVLMNAYPPPEAHPAPPPGSGVPVERFVPLDWRVTAASIAIVGDCATRLLFEGAQLAFAGELKAAEPALGPRLLVAFAGFSVLVVRILAGVFFAIFIHRAASNLRALGRSGMEYTPGWCVGWFFVPFANLVRPYRAVSEVWRASDPDAGPGADWMGSPSVPEVFRVWWGAWIISTLIGNGSSGVGDPATSSTIGLGAIVVSGVAAAACISLIHGIAARQSVAMLRGAAVLTTPQGLK